jgi:hypothetical protein
MALRTLRTEYNVEVFTFTSSVVLYGTGGRRGHEGDVATVHLRPSVSRQNFNIQSRQGTAGASAQTDPFPVALTCCELRWVSRCVKYL